MEDVERKIDQMQRKHSKSNAKNDTCKFPSSGHPCSLELIRKEVKAALQKVSSSTDLPTYDGRNMTNKNSILLHGNQPSATIIEEFENTTLEEMSAIEELKKARQLRGECQNNSISPNKKPARVGAQYVGLSDIR